MSISYTLDASSFHHSERCVFTSNAAYFMECFALHIYLCTCLHVVSCVSCKVVYGECAVCLCTMYTLLSPLSWIVLCACLCVVPIWHLRASLVIICLRINDMMLIWMAATIKMIMPELVLWSFERKYNELPLQPLQFFHWILSHSHYL